MDKRKFDLCERTEAFADRVRSLAQKVPRTEINREDITQLVRSSGSVAANYIEANEALGKRDFPMRIKICLRESKESRLWLRLLKIPSDLEAEHQFLSSEADQFVKIFATILKRVQTRTDIVSAQ